jgi:hypothetical protein
MAKTGGYRPGAGRIAKAPPHDIVQDANAVKMQPLEYMLAVMNDRTADANRRDRMAIAAAPYVHGRVSDERITKKRREAKAAKSAGIGTPWGEDLQYEIRAPQ